MAEHAYTIAARVLTAGDSSPKWIAGCIGDDSIAITADAAWKSLEGKLCLKSALAEQEISIEFSSDDSAPTASVSAADLDPRIIAAPGDLKVWAYAEGEGTRIQTTILTDLIEGARAKEYTFEYPVWVPNLGSKTITENDTYDAADDGLDGYSSVTVNVSGGFEPTAFCSVIMTFDNQGAAYMFYALLPGGSAPVVSAYAGKEDGATIAAGMTVMVPDADFASATVTIGTGEAQALTLDVEHGMWPFDIPADTPDLTEITVAFTTGN